MGLLDIASIRSIERGFNYYQSECVINLKSFSETQHEAEVKGSGIVVILIWNILENPNVIVLMLMEDE
ncbi:hypothetical protein U563_00559 [Staphylococcus aureus M62699]|nr:hypothetical protein U563_00559 [Staphylococcus aureus M62699]